MNDLQAKHGSNVEKLKMSSFGLKILPEFLQYNKCAVGPIYTVLTILLYNKTIYTNMNLLYVIIYSFLLIIILVAE